MDGPKPRITVSHSEVESYLKCERAHFYGYGLEIQPIRTPVPLARGIIGHSALDAYYTYLQEFQQEHDDWRARIDEAQNAAMEKAVAVAVSHLATEPTLAAEVLDSLNYFFQADPFRGWKVLSNEKDEVLPIMDTMAMPFKIDVKLEDYYGDVWVIDFKFMYNFLNDTQVEIMPQLFKYTGALRAMGEQVHKVAYAVLRYRDMANNSPTTRFQLKEVVVNPERIHRVLTEQVLASARIQEVKKQTMEEWSGNALRVANSFVCKGCNFLSLCSAELSQNQPSLVLNSEYEKRQRLDFDKADID